MKRHTALKQQFISESKTSQTLKNKDVDTQELKAQLLYYRNNSQIVTLGILFVISVCVILTAVNIYELRRIESGREIIIREVPSSVNSVSVKTIEERPTYWVYGRNVDSGYLKLVYLVLERLGWQRGTNESDWDLLWAHDYPFRILYPQLHKLKLHQRVNHFPGCGYVTNKVDLSTSESKYIPLAFKLPDDREKLLEHAKLNPRKMFVQKSNNHRGIHIQNVSSLDLNGSGTFVQEFIDRPFLVDGYKFDIGVYTIVTSIDPLRLYIYNGDILFRFCPVKYYPFDQNNIDKYVVGDDYLPIWEVPSLKKWYNELGFSMRDSFDAYVHKQGKNPAVIWEQVEDAIRDIYLKKEEHMNVLLQRFASKHNFFELVRFDFALDEDLNIFIMEANMSPNLSSAHFPPNQLLYEQVLFNMFGLVGLGVRLKKPSLQIRSSDEESMQTADKNIVVNPTICSSEECYNSCMSPECLLCLPCWSSQTKENLVHAYREHINKGDYKRIFPPTMQQDSLLESKLEHLSPENKLMYKWFHGKCLLDKSWC